MKYKVNNYMVLTVNNNDTLAHRGFYISKEFFSTYAEAREYMIEETKKFKTKEVDIEKDSIYIDCGEYCIEMNIIDCSSYIKITDIES